MVHFLYTHPIFGVFPAWCRTTNHRLLNSIGGAGGRRPGRGLRSGRSRLGLCHRRRGGRAGHQQCLGCFEICLNNYRNLAHDTPYRATGRLARRPLFGPRAATIALGGSRRKTVSSWRLSAVLAAALGDSGGCSRRTKVCVGISKVLWGFLGFFEGFMHWFVRRGFPRFV